MASTLKHYHRGQLPSWPVLNELRLVANSVKHAEGGSADELRKLRPDLFQHPAVPSELQRILPPGPIHLPMMGEDLFVSPEDLQRYKDALANFWREFGAALNAAS
jgi:hypothetical protein